jgi:hypothetical protein
MLNIKLACWHVGIKQAARFSVKHPALRGTLEQKGCLVCFKSLFIRELQNKSNLAFDKLHVPPESDGLQHSSKYYKSVSMPCYIT